MEGKELYRLKLGKKEKSLAVFLYKKKVDVEIRDVVYLG